MQKHFLKLATENFYASADSMRNFFMLGMSEEAFNFDTVERKPDISLYGAEYNTIHITGMMLREQSWITDMGFATSTEQVINGIKETLSEGKKVKLIINSGGGLVSGTSNLADLIYENRDQIEAYATGTVASAAMWVYSCAGKRYAEATTVMGSIGVVTSVFDDEKYWASYGIIWKEIVSENAKNKRPDMKTEEGRNEIKRYLTSLETVFIDSVARSLDMTKEEVVSNFHQGGLITGKDALELKAISALTTYDLVATMPSERSAEKIAKISNMGESVMITQEQFDAVNASLATANASIEAMSAENATLKADVEKVTADLVNVTAELASASTKLSVMGEIVGMAFEHGVTKETAVAMVSAGSKAEAALVALSAKTSTGATVVTADLEEGADASVDEEQAEIDAAIAIAKKLSVNSKK